MKPETLSLIETLHDIHKGWHCFIIGNSPSLFELSETQKSVIQNSIIIGTNSSYKLFKSQYHWFVHSDAENMTQDDVLFLDSTLTPCFNIDVVWEKHRFKNTHYLNYLGGQGWSNDLTKGVYCAATVVHAAIQFAAWIGCEKITLIGCDMIHRDNVQDFRGRSNTDEGINYQCQNETLTQCIKPLTERGIKLLQSSPYYSFNTIEKVTI